MIRSTLCYLEKDGCYLMLLRNKKKQDCNKGKWIGVGGKFEEGETAEECIAREVFEETGIRLISAHFYGVVEFRSDTDEDEDMYLFSSSSFEGETDTDKIDCSEGTLKWIPKDEIMDLRLWEGDRIFLQKMLDGEEKIKLRLEYTAGELTGTAEYKE